MAGETRTTAPGPTEIGAWQNQIIKPGATVGGNTTSAGVAATANPNAVALYNMTRQERQQVALALKNAGYKVPTNGVFSDKLLNAYNTALAAAQTQAMQAGQPFDKNFFTGYLARETEANIAAGGAGGISKLVQTKIYTDADAKKIIDTVIQDQLGRKASADEVRKYTSMIQAAQKKSPTVTTYKTVGGVQTATTTGGINEQQYLLDRIAGTDEAKANKVLGFYETFMNALGRD